MFPDKADLTLNLAQVVHLGEQVGHRKSPLGGSMPAVLNYPVPTSR